VLVDPATGTSVTEPRYRTVAGPAADERTRRQLAFAEAEAAKEPAHV